MRAVAVSPCCGGRPADSLDALAVRTYRASPGPWPVWGLLGVESRFAIVLLIVILRLSSNGRRNSSSLARGEGHSSPWSPLLRRKTRADPDPRKDPPPAASLRQDWRSPMGAGRQPNRNARGGGGPSILWRSRLIGRGRSDRRTAKLGPGPRGGHHPPMRRRTTEARAAGATLGLIERKSMTTEAREYRSARRPISTWR